MDTIDEASVSVARSLVREVAARNQIRSVVAESMAIVASELAMNQLRHSARGRIEIRSVRRDGVPGLEIDAEDAGPGLRDVTEAFKGHLRCGASLGIGLASVRRLAFEIDVESRSGEGTRIVARLFDQTVRRRPTVTVLGRPHPSEQRSGDAARFWRLDDSLLVVLCDGLGHGAMAREAADLALATAGDRLTQSPDEILAACGAALAGTRGAALAVVRLDERGWLEAISVGNIEGGIATGAVVRAVGSRPGVVGRPSELHTPRVNRMPMLAGARLLLATDGVLAPLAELRAPLPADFPLWSLAQRVFDSPSRDDDATVIVIG